MSENSKIEIRGICLYVVIEEMWQPEYSDKTNSFADFSNVVPLSLSRQHTLRSEYHLSFRPHSDITDGIL